MSYKLKLSKVPKAGLVKFVVRNSSGDEHDFWIGAAASPSARR